MRHLTQQVGSFVHVSYHVISCRRQLLKQRLCVAIKCKILNATFRRRAAWTEKIEGESETREKEKMIIIMVKEACYCNITIPPPLNVKMALS